MHMLDRAGTVIFPATCFSAQWHDDVRVSNWSEVSPDASGMVLMQDAVISNYGHTDFYSKVSELGHWPISLAA
jgi:hypothetical protein